MYPARDDVTSPDQRKPRSRRLDRAAAIVVAALLILLLAATNPNAVEIAWVCGCAAALLLAVVADWWLRRSRLRS